MKKKKQIFTHSNAKNTSICFINMSAFGYFDSRVETAGGAERQLHLLSKNLTKYFEVNFIVGDYDQEDKLIIDEVRLFKSYRPSVKENMTKKIIKLFKLFQSIRQVNADVYIFRGNPLRACITQRLCRLNNSKWIYSVANDNDIEPIGGDHSPTVRKLFETSLKNADGIVCQTSHQSKILEQELGTESIVIPNGYPKKDMISPIEEREYFLWVGRIDKAQKRPHLVIEAAKKLPNEKFLIVGPPSNSGEYQKKLEADVEKYENIEYIGFVEPSRIDTYYENAIALINTSLYEGFPNTFLEAWRNRTPVISYEISVNRYVNDENLQADADGEMQDFVDLLQKYSSDIGFRRDQTSRVYQKFVENYTISKTSVKYKNYISYVLSEDKEA